MQQNQLGGTKHLGQNGEVSFLIFLSTNRGPRRLRQFGACFQLLCCATIWVRFFVSERSVSSLSDIPHSEPRWQKLYEAAVLELDLEVLPRRIDLARKAIKLRVERLVCSGESAEIEPLFNALNVLDDLQKMDLARRDELKRKAEH